VSLELRSLPPLATGQKIGPSEIPEAASHALTALTGQHVPPNHLALPLSPSPLVQARTVTRLRLATRFTSTSGTVKYLAIGAGDHKRDGANSP